LENIYFIEAKSPGAHIYSKVALPRLGTILLATILKNEGYNSKTFIEDIAEPDWNELEKADLIGISSITSTAPRAFDLAKRFRSKGISIVMGGPHSTFLQEESLEYADYVVRGEGEVTIVELIEHLNLGKPLHDIKGLSFNEDGKIFHNPDRPLIEDLDSIPIPDFSLVHEWSKKKRKTVPIATSRGCPFGCKFCSVIQMFGRKYRFNSINRVIEELKIHATKRIHIFFIDDNFAANKARTKELLKRMIDENIDIEWSAQFRVDVAEDPELVGLMQIAGCVNCFIGFESINPMTLELYNKKQELTDIEECIKVLRKAHINIHGMFVLGGDTDEIKTIWDTLKFAKRQKITSIQFLMLTPLPGTPVFYDFLEHNRLLSTNWENYDAHHAVFDPERMTAIELHVTTLKAMSKFYSWSYITKNFFRFKWLYMGAGIYGKHASHEALKKAKDYVEELKSSSADKLKKYLEKIRLSKGKR